MAKHRSDTVLELSDAAVSLAGRSVFSGVNLSVARGEFVGILGPNGAGKTTLMRAILGLVPLSAGQLATSARIGYVPQRHEVAWDFPMTVADCVLSGRTGVIGWLRRPQASDRALAAAAIAQVSLTALAQRPIAELSGGQRQRVLIARALATEPDILLMDEPFTGLDAPRTEELLELFEQLAQRGVAVIMSTHNLAEAAHSCQRLVLFRGRVIADGPARDIAAQRQRWVDTFEVTEQSPLLAALGTPRRAA